MKFSGKIFLKPICFLIFSILVGYELYGFIVKENQTYGLDNYNPYYKTFIDKEVIILGKQIETLQSVARDLDSTQSSLNEVKNQCVHTRKAFKRLEGILSYYFPKHVNAYINGAPLDHVSPLPTSKDFEKASYYLGSIDDYKNSLPLDMLEAGHYSGETFTILAPEGLQRIDELLFVGGGYRAKSELVDLTGRLNASFKILKNTVLLRKYYFDFEIIESSRLDLIRILSKGITGFDTPGSLNAIEEASVSLQGLEEILKPLIDASSTYKKSLKDRFSGAQKFIKKNRDFDTFDRLTFIKSYLNPLYKELLLLQQELDIPSSAEKYNQTASWNAQSVNVFANDFLNPYYYSILKNKDDSSELRQLGKKLFFDKNLSHSQTVSCASCHNPKLAYSDGERTSKSSIIGETLTRNAPSLINSIFSDRYFYDLRAFDLENQVEHVIVNHLEYNTNIEAIVGKINKDDAYQEDFKNIYQSQSINRYQLSAALASYVISLRSFNSDFDKYMRGEISSLNSNVKRGFNLFMGKANCATCHFAPTFSGLIPPLYQENESEVLGVLKKPGSFIVDSDPGRINNGVDKDNQEIFNKSFKTTTVRNTTLTAPYFHNGAYNSLEEVLEFYNLGGAQGIGLYYEVPNQTLASEPLNLTDDEIQDIIAFMTALNDINVDISY
ncbi:cytochrome-c peroxidase [Pseudotamlana agarivorans]|uniref:cytochrome-c peroxidase n=1 Tax=Pseudotamlana agarivorans TaxID=481183 RepID=UPI0008374902|nr:cytochrome c peroxidase [Tamlana agarivorans]